MENVIYSTKEINPNHYFELGEDKMIPVLYVYKNGNLIDRHFSYGNTSFMSEMDNTIKYYKKIHNEEPKMKDIIAWRQWFKVLKGSNYIN